MLHLQLPTLPPGVPSVLWPREGGSRPTVWWLRGLLALQEALGRDPVPSCLASYGPSFMHTAVSQGLWPLQHWRN